MTLDAIRKRHALAKNRMWHPHSDISDVGRLLEIVDACDELVERWARQAQADDLPVRRHTFNQCAGQLRAVLNG